MEPKPDGLTRRAFLARAATALTGASALGFGSCVLEHPISSGDPARGRGSRAALAIRDRANPFFQQGTKLFTVPNLERGYAEVSYWTQREHHAAYHDDIAGTLARLLREYEHVDVWLSVYAGKPWWELLEGAERAPRLVYSTGGADVRFASEWLDRGVQTYVSHAGIYSVSPIFYVYFLRRWLGGQTVEDAVRVANARVEPRLTFLLEQLADPARARMLWEETRAMAFGDERLTLTGGPA
jgi:hypothetical protein